MQWLHVEVDYIEKKKPTNNVHLYYCYFSSFQIVHHSLTDSKYKS